MVLICLLQISKVSRSLHLQQLILCCSTTTQPPHKVLLLGPLQCYWPCSLYRYPCNYFRVEYFLVILLVLFALATKTILKTLTRIPPAAVLLAIRQTINQHLFSTLLHHHHVILERQTYLEVTSGVHVCGWKTSKRLGILAHPVQGAAPVWYFAVHGQTSTNTQTRSLKFLSKS